MSNKSVNESAIKAKKNRGRRKRKKAGKKKRTVLAILLAIVVLFGIKIATQEYKIYQLKSQEAQLEQQISDEKLKSDEVNEEISNSSSKSYIEYLARKYLGLIYPGEKVYVEDEGDSK